MITDAARKWWVLAGMTSAVSMSMLDATIAGVLLPSIQDELNLSQSGTAWVVSAYLLSLGVLLPVAGRIADALGTAHSFVLGISLFAAASVGVALAPSEAWIVTLRAVQGAGAAIMTPPTTTMIFAAFPTDSRGKAMSIYSGVGLGFTTVGPLLGGVLAESVGWRWAFLINVPIAVAGIVLTMVARPRNIRQPVRSWDPVGLGLLLAGMGGLVLGLQESVLWGWGSPATLGCVLGGLALLVVFCRWELRRDIPLLNLRLFARRAFRASNAVLFACNFAMVAVTVYAAVWLQSVLAFSPAASGAAIIPMILTLIAASQLAGRAYDRQGPRRLVATGCVLTGVGMLGTVPGLLLQSYPALVPALVLIGIGLGQVMTPSMTGGLAAVSDTARARASGLIATVRGLGAAVGAALIGGVIHSVEGWHITDLVRESTQTQSSLSTATAVGFVIGGLAVCAAATFAWRGYADTRVPSTQPATAGVTH